MTLLYYSYVELNRLVEFLNEKADKIGHSSPLVYVPEQKHRVLADLPSALKAPTDALKWAIKSRCVKRFLILIDL